MKNIYKITKSQLITTWIFVGIILVLLFIRFNDYCYISDISCKNGGSIIPLIIILFVMIFYTIGWKNYNKEKDIKN